MAEKGKLQLRVEDELWKQVQQYKLDHNLPNLNEAVVELIEKGLRGE